MSKRSKCVGAGMALARWGAEETTFYPENVRGYVRADDLVVPHSEMAMHVGAAGKSIEAWSCRRDGRGCAVVWAEPDGGCGFTSGAPGEALSVGLRNVMQDLFRYKGLAGLGRRRRSRR